MQVFLWAVVQVLTQRVEDEWSGVSNWVVSGESMAVFTDYTALWMRMAGGDGWVCFTEGLPRVGVTAYCSFPYLIISSCF